MVFIIVYLTMWFKIIDNCHQNARHFYNPRADFFLELDSRSDFSYYTTYHLHANGKRTRKGGTRYLGPIKIMRKGQAKGEKYVLREAFRRQNGEFSQLSDKFVSISFSLELYQEIVRLLQTQEKRREFATALQMLFDKDDSRYAVFAEEECFASSLLRDTTIDSFVLKKGKQLLYDEMVFYDLEKKKLSVKYKNVDHPVELDFNPIPEAIGISSVPYGIIAFIGQNGGGKSSFLYQLAKLLYLPPTERYLMKEVVKVEPSEVGISKLLMFSYSAFDNFLFPGNSIADYRLMSEGVENRKGRFIYCGVRDIKKEIDHIIRLNRRNDVPSNTQNDDEPYLVTQERAPKIYLKSVDSLASEFEDALLIIKDRVSTKKQWKALGHDCQELLPDIYAEIQWVFEFHATDTSSLKEEFVKLSTGIKFFLHTMSHIFAYNEDNSLLLFDEPESHLHPPMLSFMMKHIREAIRYTHSVMLIATHSPVILQELFAKNVYVVRQNSGGIIIRHPNTETYGENFGYINNLVFNLNSDVSSFHTVFEELFDKWNCRMCANEEEVINTFQSRLKCDNLSSQMVAYLVNLYNNPIV